MTAPIANWLESTARTEPLNRSLPVGMTQTQRRELRSALLLLWPDMEFGPAIRRVLLAFTFNPAIQDAVAQTEVEWR